MDNVIVHPRVTERHPELSEEDVLVAWSSYVRMAYRGNDQAIAIGFDGKGRALEMSAKTTDGNWLIYYALTPPTINALQELGMAWR